MVNTIDLESQGQIKGGLTKPDILKKYGNSAWRVMTILGLLVSSSCSVTEAQNNISKPAETAPIPGANEPQLAMQPFEINKEYPEALQPYVDVFKNMATKDKLDLNLINNFDFILARDPAKGTTVEYALMPMAVVNGLTDPDNEPANQKPVYYLAYKDEQGQVIGNYVLGRLLEQDSEGNVSYVSRILADASFQDWLNNTQPVDSQIDLGQIVYATALANGIDIKEARKIEQQLTGGELSSADFMKQYALGVSFIQPGQVARQVTIVNPLMPDNTPVEPSIVPSFWSRLFGVQPALAAGLELEATATAPGSTPIIEPTSSAEPTPTIEPTLSAEQQQQVIMNQFVNEPFYDQYIVDNQIPEQAATAFYKEYPGVEGEAFAIVTMKVDPNSLSEEQKALNIPQRDYLVVKTADGQLEFKLLPVNLQLETFSQSAVEFTLSKEYQQGLQDYLNAMGLEAGAVVISQMVKEVNEIGINLIVVDYHKLALTSVQQEYEKLFAHMPLFEFDENVNKWEKMTLGRAAEINALNIGVYVGSYGIPDNWEKRTALQKQEFNAGLTVIDWPQIQTNIGHIEFPEGIRNDTKLASIPSMNQTYFHAIIWPLRAPNYLKSLSSDQVRNEVENYIRTIMKEYQTIGKNRVFNIVNEAYYPGDILQQKLGKDYVTELFRLAAQLAKPGDILIYNDYNILPGSYSKAGSRTKMVMDILNKLQNDPLIKESGIQIGLGIQAHLYGDNKMMPEEYSQILDSFNVPVFITEASVIMTNEGGSDRLKKQADVYSRLIAGMQLSKNCNTIYIFGTDDYTSWFERSIGELEGASKNADPLLFDDYLNPKPAYYAILSTLLQLGSW